MKKGLLLLMLLYCSLLASAQIGANAGYSYIRAESDVYGTWLIELSSVVGVNYWFRLKNKRVEFFPTLELNSTKISNDQFVMRDMTLVSGYLNTRFYVFDFQGDCNCPTFSKHGGSFDKGFFLSIAPGVEYSNTNIQTKDDSFRFKAKEVMPSISVGTGFDIGISNLLTLTPYTQFRYAASNDTRLERWIVGINIGLRFD
ncbi:MAG: hypothetical protein HC892_06560 [Saprospiraceae bacterium]|nr:hypothetical protein [Saprospiraceae bacterium]